MTDYAHFPLIDLSGSPRERGHSHGKAAADRLRRGARMYAESLLKSGVDWTELERRAEAMVPTIDKFDPAYVEEMRGIAEGAGEPFAAVMLMNARTEMVAAARRQQQGAAGDEQQREAGTRLLIADPHLPLFVEGRGRASLLRLSGKHARCCRHRRCRAHHAERGHHAHLGARWPEPPGREETGGRKTPSRREHERLDLLAIIDVAVSVVVQAERARQQERVASARQEAEAPRIGHAVRHRTSARPVQ